MKGNKIKLFGKKIRIPTPFLPEIHCEVPDDWQEDLKDLVYYFGLFSFPVLLIALTTWLVLF